jgi:flagellar biosynthetic protein FliO
VKPIPFLAAALTALVFLAASPVWASAAGVATTPATAKAQTAAELAQNGSKIAKANNAKDAARRAKGSAFEREELDQSAFAPDSPTTTKASAGGGGSIVRMLMGLAVVGGLIYGIHWLLRKWGRSRAQGIGGSSGVIDVVATTPLSQGRSLHLIRVGQELVLVGATEQSITRLGEVDGRSLGLAGVGTPETGSFPSLLQGAIQVGPGVDVAPAISSLTSSPPASTGFVSRFVENLKLNTAR